MVSVVAWNTPFNGKPIRFVSDWGDIAITDKAVLSDLLVMGEDERESFFVRLVDLVKGAFERDGRIESDNPPEVYTALRSA